MKTNKTAAVQSTIEESQAKATTELAVITAEANLPATIEDHGDDFTGYDDFEQSDFVIPRVKIVQPTAKTGNPGTFLMNLTGEEFAELDVVLIKVARSRVLWNRDDTKAEKPLCRSFDMINPSCEGLDNDPISPVCAQVVIKGRKRITETVCPKAAWGVNKKRPECSEVYNLLCVSADGIPFWLNVSGASIKGAKGYISSIALRRKRLCDFLTAITLEKRIEPHTHYVLKLSPPERIEDEAVEAMVSDMVESLRDQTVERAIAAEEAAAEGGMATVAGDGDEETEPDWVNEG